MPEARIIRAPLDTGNLTRLDFVVGWRTISKALLHSVLSGYPVADGAFRDVELLCYFGKSHASVFLKYLHGFLIQPVLRRSKMRYWLCFSKHQQAMTMVFSYSAHALPKTRDSTKTWGKLGAQIIHYKKLIFMIFVSNPSSA